VIKLASNENCLGPSPLALEAMKQSASRTNRYPDGNGYYLRKALAEKLQVEFDQIVLGNGSTDLVNIIARTYLESGDNTVTLDQTFLMYKIATLTMNATCIQVPLQNYKCNLEAIVRAVDSHTKIIYLANPNNPTGTLVTKQELDEFLQALPKQVLVVLDEAYFDYVEDEEYPDGILFTRKYSNLIVLRTFSKVYGLAGIRMGYGIADPEIIENLNRVRSPFNTNVLAQSAALAALQDHEHVNKSRETNREERNFVEKELSKLGVPFVHSVANFILIPTEDATKIYEALLRDGIIVRPMNSFHMQEGLRVTIGKHDENVAFLSALAKIWR
jgi:histidinol-phosphate aminotransferase